MEVIDLVKAKEGIAFLQTEGHSVWADNLSMCIARIERQRRDKNKSKKKENLISKARGVCREGGCENPVIFPCLRCDHHQAVLRKKAKEKRAWRRENNACTRCSSPMIENEIEIYNTCMNCREKRLRAL